jgi:kynurenine 3-monooxygenase
MSFLEKRTAISIASLLIAVASEEARAISMCPELEQHRHRRIVIVGGGPVGATLAIRLADLGGHPELIEKRPDPRIHDPDSGRTFNITLATRGIEALPPKVREAVLAETSPIVGRRIHLPNGKLTDQFYGIEGNPDHAIHAISRIRLAQVLLKEAENRGVKVVFNTDVSNVDITRARLTVAERLGGADRSAQKTRELGFHHLLGTDGTSSTVRTAVKDVTRGDEDIRTLEAGYRAFQIPAKPDGTPVFDHGWLHLWPRTGIVVTGIPNRDGTFSMILVMPLSGRRSFDDHQAGRRPTKAKV